MDFTTILNKGIRRHIDKNIKKRSFGRCENCEKTRLLINYIEENSNDIFHVCEFCYTEFLNDK